MSPTQVRTQRIIELAACGASDEEIASQMKIAVAVVERHWRRLFARFKVSTRPEALLASVCERLSAQDQKLAAEISARQDLERRLKDAQDELLVTHLSLSPGLATQLAKAHRDLVAAKLREHEFDLCEDATDAGSAVVYELASIEPIVYRQLSKSAARFGIDVGKALAGQQTFYDFVESNDWEEIVSLVAGRPYRPYERYLYLYRIRAGLRRRWVLDSQRPIFDEHRALARVVGVAVDVEDLVASGAIRPKATVVAIPDDPPPLPDFEPLDREPVP